MWIFERENICGHYHIDLADINDRALMQRMMQLGFTDKKKRERAAGRSQQGGNKPIDLSQKGNGEWFRNEMYRAVGEVGYTPFQVITDAACLLFAKEQKVKKGTDTTKSLPTVQQSSGLWQIVGLPIEGTIEFDIVPFDAPPLKADATDQQTVSALLPQARAVMRQASRQLRIDAAEDSARRNSGGGAKGGVANMMQLAMQAAKLEARAYIEWLRRSVVDLYLTTDHVLQLMQLIDGQGGCLPGGFSKESLALKLDVLMLLINRLVDKHNLVSVIRPQFQTYKMPAPAMPPEIDHDIWPLVQHRIGKLSMFSPFLPEGPLALDLAQSDDKQLVAIMLKLAACEPNVDKLKEANPKSKAKLGDCFSDFAYESGKGKSKTVNKLPAKWFEEPPTTGKLNCTYSVEPEWCEWKARTDVATRMMGWNLTQKQSALNMEAEWHAANCRYKQAEMITAEQTYDSILIQKAEDNISAAELTQFLFEEERRKQDLKAMLDLCGYGKKPSAKVLSGIQEAKEAVVEIQDELNSWYVTSANKLHQRAKAKAQESLDSLAAPAEDQNGYHRIGSFQEQDTGKKDKKLEKKLEKERKKVEKEIGKCLEAVQAAEDRIYMVAIERAEGAREETKAACKGGKPCGVVMAVHEVEIAKNEVKFALSLIARAKEALASAEESGDEKKIKAAEKVMESMSTSVAKKQKAVLEAIEHQQEEEVAKAKRKALAAKRAAKKKADDAAAEAKAAAEFEAMKSGGKGKSGKAVASPKGRKK